MNNDTLQFNGDILVAILHLREAIRLFDSKGLNPESLELCRFINSILCNYHLVESDIKEADLLNKSISNG